MSGWEVFALSAASTALGTLQQIGAAQSQRRAAEYNARVAENNALAARQRAAFEADQKRRDQTLKLGRMQARIAKSGGTVEGSPLDVIGDDTAESEKDIQSIYSLGEANAQKSLADAAEQRAQAGDALDLGYLGAGKTLLGGLGAAWPGKRPKEDQLTSDSTPVRGPYDTVPYWWNQV